MRGLQEATRSSTICLRRKSTSEIVDLLRQLGTSYSLYSFGHSTACLSLARECPESGVAEPG